MTADLPEGWDWPFRCTNCGRDYPSRGLPYRCPTCGGHYDLVDGLRYEPGSERGFEHYSKSFPLPPGSKLYSLGEGNTPLVVEEMDQGRVYLKCEHLNPTGSFKDRGTAVLVSALKAVGVEEAVDDSSGNAGASFAAYAARTGIRARVFVPDYASGPKRAQIEAYGAELVPIVGTRSATTEAALRAVDGGSVYASHAHMPHIVAGMATLAFEIAEALGRAPGALVLPVGQGTLLLGAHLGFKALLEAGVTDSMPALIGVQAQACAPLWAAHESGSAQQDPVQEQATIAEGIRIPQPLRGQAVLRAVEETDGAIAAVEEAQIERGLAELARRGFLVEPTSAVIWPVLEQLLPELPEPVVAVLTGSGFKSGPESWPVGVAHGASQQAAI
ncbi:MAG: pyridoxal-phosphate dependent enzyme [Anaerolineales bacterium]